MKTVGARIKETLAELGKSQQWLADQVGIKQPSINAIIQRPDLKTRHTVRIAKALGVTPDWLETGRGEKRTGGRSQALIVGKVGAGAEIHRLEEGVVLASIEPPSGVGDCNAAEIEGDSMHPLQDGWLIFYGEEHRGIPDECVGKLCVLQVKDGPTLLKTLKRGTRKGFWRLESWNAPAREDVKVEWAAKVIDIRPT